MMDFKKKEIIGMIHLAGPDAIEKALEEIKIYEEEGLSGIIIENYHGGVYDIIRVLERLRFAKTTLSVGINILPNEYEIAFDICEQYDFIDFIQLDYLGGSYKTNVSLDEDKFIAAMMSCRPVQVFGGVWPKYYTPVEGSVLSDDLFTAMFFGDAVVVTGEGTGSETPLDKIKLFRSTMDEYNGKKIIGRKKPLIIGAGLTPLNVREQLEYAQGAIVGSAFKPNGRTMQMVDRDLVKTFMDEVKKI